MEETMMTGLDLKISEVAARIKELRQIGGMSVETMAKLTGVSREEYVACEEGNHDLSFAFIYRCALAFKVNVTDIIEGRSPRLAGYTVTRKGEGQEIQKAQQGYNFEKAAELQYAQRRGGDRGSHGSGIQSAGGL